MFKIKVCMIMIVLFMFLLASTVQASLDDYFADVDFGGQTINYVSNLIPGSGSARMLAVEKAQDKFNLKFNFIKLGYEEVPEVQYSRVLGGDAVNDIWYTPMPFFWQNVDEGIYYPLDQFIQDIPDEYWENMLKDQMMLYMEKQYSRRGQTFGFHNLVLPLNMPLVWFNKTFLEDMALNCPLDLYEEGEWTWAAFEELARNVTRDTTGDGVIDTGVIYNSTILPPYVMTLINGGKIVEEDENGDLKFVMDSEEAYTAWRTWRKWVHEDEIIFRHHQFETIPIAFGYEAHMMRNQFMAPADEAGQEWGIVPTPMGPNAGRYITVLCNSAAFNIPLNAEEPEKLFKLNAWIQRETTSHNAWNHQENLISRFVMDPRSFNAIREMIKRWEGENIAIPRTFFQDGRSDAPRIFLDINMNVAEGMSPEAAINAVKPQAQAFLDDKFNN